MLKKQGDFYVDMPRVRKQNFDPYTSGKRNLFVYVVSVSPMKVVNVFNHFYTRDASHKICTVQNAKEQGMATVSYKLYESLRNSKATYISLIQKLHLLHLQDICTWHRYCKNLRQTIHNRSSVYAFRKAVIMRQT